MRAAESALTMARARVRDELLVTTCDLGESTGIELSSGEDAATDDGGVMTFVRRMAWIEPEHGRLAGAEGHSERPLERGLRGL